jgi:hypothetical protein
MQIHLVLTVDVDEDAYALEYGQAAHEVRRDALEHVPALMLDAVKGTAKTMGYFTVARHAASGIEAGPAGRRAKAPTLTDRLPAPTNGFWHTADPRVLIAAWGDGPKPVWKCLVEWEDGWDCTGEPHDTMAAALAYAPFVASYCF